MCIQEECEIRKRSFSKTVGKDKHVEGVKMELTTEADLFFNFVFEYEQIYLKKEVSQLVFIVFLIFKCQ